MNPLMQQLVNQKIKTITAQELNHYANQYGITLSHTETTSLLHLLHNEKIDIFNKAKQQQLLKKVEKIVGIKVAKKLNQMLQQFNHLL